MKCPYCKSENTYVRRTKKLTQKNEISRERRCRNCGRAYWTKELIIKKERSST